MKCVFLTWLKNWFLAVLHIAAVCVRKFVVSPVRAVTACCVGVALLDKQNTVAEWLCDIHLYLV